MTSPLPPAAAAPCVDILHVEDDDAYAELVRKWVAPGGFTKHRVRTLEELLKYLSACPRLPRCLLLDLGLTDCDGLFLCDVVKKAPSLQGMPIILFSGANLSSRECMEHGVLYFVRKGAHGQPELLAALNAVISQHARSQGVVDIGDLRLNPEGHEVGLAGRPVARLTPGRFTALLALVKAAPKAVSDEDLYLAFLQRHPYHRKGDWDPSTVAIVKNYVSHLRADLGDLGARIERVRGEGYAYRP